MSDFILFYRAVVDLISPECVDALKNIHNVVNKKKRFLALYVKVGSSCLFLT